MTSYDVIRRLQRRLGRSQRIGHAGTLDPLAEGVLVLCLGPATRLVDVIQSYDKEYVTLIRLGASSTTDDSEGELTPVAVAEPPTRPAVESILAGFRGAIMQTPPAFSAVKVAGQRAYDLARAGEKTELAARPVQVHEIEILAYAWPELRLRVRCGSGTYIRALARDIGAALGVGGHCREIVRTRVGVFTQASAITIAQLETDHIGRLLIPPLQAVAPEDIINVTAEQAADLSLGRAVPADLPPAAATRPFLAAVDPAGVLIGLVRPDPQSRTLRPWRMFHGKS
jgi:tRNA pseudouridine55 synthase